MNFSASTGDDTVRRNLHTLDAMRGIAAIAVLGLHYAPYFRPLGTPSGYLAVDLFFILSGCVIDHAYRARLQAGMTAQTFMRLRLIRLYPLYSFGLLAGCAVALAGMALKAGDTWNVRNLTSATLLGLIYLPFPVFGPRAPAFPLNPLAWTLFYELVANLAFVLLFRRVTRRTALVGSIAFGLMLVAMASIFGTLDLGRENENFLFGLPRVAFGFSAGILISRLRSAAVADCHPGESFALMAATVVAFCMAWPDGWTRTAWELACVLLVFPALVYRASMADPPGWAVPTASFLGVTSYGLYVFQGPVQGSLTAMARLLHVNLARGAPLMGLSLAGGLLALAWVLNRWLDVPARRWALRRLPGPGRLLRGDERVQRTR